MSGQVEAVDVPSFVDFDGELQFWRAHHRHHPFFRPGLDFVDYEPALKLGINVFLDGHGRTFDELREQLAEPYERTRGNSPLDWNEASAAAEAAWLRMQHKLVAA
ncbi:MAG: hypothetical protein ACREPV_14175 [Lysobacter sp.]